jgi:signal transduction histidine kinase
MPGLCGTSIIEKAKHQNPDIEAIIITGYGTIDTAVEGLRLGAFDYITKPFDMNHVLIQVRRALGRKQLTENERNRVEKVEEKDRLKRQLVAALAHDIKDPLGLIVLCADALTMHTEAKRHTDKDLEFLAAIHHSAQRIVKLVTGLLDASKLEAGYTCQRNPVQLNTLVRKTGEEQAIALKEKRLKLKLDLEESMPAVRGDEDQLERVLWNLVGNAIKFSPSGGEITVSSRLENGHACVLVSDTGAGIPREELPLLFSEFRRLSGSGEVEGTGLGLYIVKTIVEAHGGKVEADSQIGAGSTFTIRIPVNGSS